MEFVIPLLVGYIVGLAQRGVHVHLHDKKNEVPTEYNQSINANEEIKAYYEQTGGINKF